VLIWKASPKDGLHRFPARFGNMKENKNRGRGEPGNGTDAGARRHFMVAPSDTFAKLALQFLFEMVTIS
jgi:hypothetical protein